MGAIARGIIFSVFPFVTLPSQVVTFPYSENFDSVAVPKLPPGWEASTNRLTSGDFFSTTTSPRSAPHAVQSVNSTLPQILTSPMFDLTGRVPRELQFYIARSGTHTCPVLVETSWDGGLTWPLVIGDTLVNPGSTGYRAFSIGLPDTLANQPSCRFRWRTLGGTGGTSGTLRIDDVSISVHVSYDLSAERISLSPSRPSSGDPITLRVTITSHGLYPAFDYTVHWYLETNDNGVADENERFAQVSGPVILPGDSADIEATHSPLPVGIHQLFAIVDLADDEDRRNDTVLTAVEIGVAPGSIIVNEIMYAPAGDEPEWIEFLNTTSLPIDLRDWRISDSRTSSRTTIRSEEFIVKPGTFALVARDSMFFLVHDSIDVPTAISPFSALNNTTSDAVVLFDNRGVTMDSVRYEPSWGISGISLERIDPFTSSLDPSNWTSSTRISGSSPGMTNSVALPDRDLRFVSVGVYGTIISALVANSGRHDVYGVRILLDAVIDEGLVSIGVMEFTGTLQRGATTLLSYEWMEIPAGKTPVILRIDFPDDQRPGNNSDTVSVIGTFKPETVVINEIMYEPLGGESEWVELCNKAALPVNLRGWHLQDAATQSGSVNRFTFSEDHRILPDDVFVVSADSAIFQAFPQADRSRIFVANLPGGLGLGNEGDAVTLTDLTGTIIDSVRYSASWHHPRIRDTRGRSLERIHPDLPGNDPRNWSTSAGLNGGSPGERNSIYTAGGSSGSTLSFTPNPFSPDGDGHEDVCRIRFHLPSPSSVARILIFDLQGRIIRTLADGEVFGESGDIPWDGTETTGRKARIGPHIVLLEAVLVDGTHVSAKGVVVVATRL